MNAQIGFGQVRHQRFRPCLNSFVYSTFFLMLPMRFLSDADNRLSIESSLAWNTKGALSFHDIDHGDARGEFTGGALGWFDELLKNEGVQGVDGEVWLHTYPRVWGYAFKPVSFWYGHALNGELKVIVVEVNNTFGERHFYLIKNPVYGRDLFAHKEFHVSPFCEVVGQYRFRFLRTATLEHKPERTVVRIDYEDGEGVLIHTSISGLLLPLTKATRRKALMGYPLMTLMVIYRIHWQAFKLWLKNVSFHSKPKKSIKQITPSLDNRP